MAMPAAPTIIPRFFRFRFRAFEVGGVVSGALTSGDPWGFSAVASVWFEVVSWLSDDMPQLLTMAGDWQK
jgi:hypothetical protein